MILPLHLLIIQQLNCSNSKLMAMNQLIENLLQKRQFSDVQFIIQSTFSNNSEIVDGIYKKVSQAVPSSCISLNDSIPAKLPSFHASHGTLLLYIYISKTPPDVQQREDIIRVMVYSDTRPKVLLITILEERNCNFETLLKQMWNKYFIDVTILELSEFDEYETAIKVHQYNPFTRVYTRQPYGSDIQWFPNKITNLYGYPLQVYIVNRIGHLFVTRNSQGYPVIVRGPDKNVLDSLASNMNFTFTMLPIVNDETGALPRNVDIIIPALPYFMDDFYTNVEHSLPLTFENWCPVVPITYTYDRFEMRGYINIAINASFVLIFWAISVVFKFDPKFWQPLKIFGVIISTSVAINPKKTVERIMFINVFLVSVLYSVNLYAVLATDSITGKTEVTYNSYKELDESGLTPVVLKLLFNTTFYVDDESFYALKRKALSIKAISNCGTYLAKYRNVTCFMPVPMVNAIIYWNMRKSRANMKICKNLCYATPPVGYVLKKYSPYKNRIVDIVVRLESSGIHSRWYRNFTGKFSPKKLQSVKLEDLNQMSLVWNISYITISFYLLSFLIFLGEIVVHYADNNKKANNFQIFRLNFYKCPQGCYNNDRIV